MQYAVLFSPIVLLTSLIFHSHPLSAPRTAITQRLDAALRRWSASPHQFFFHLSRLTANLLEAKRGLTTELFSPAPVHRSHPFPLTIKPEPATVNLRPVVLALPTGRADGRIYHFTKPLELQNFPWVRRNTHVVAIECSAAHDRRNDTVHSYLQRV